MKRVLWTLSALLAIVLAAGGIVMMNHQDVRCSSGTRCYRDDCACHVTRCNCKIWVQELGRFFYDCECVAPYNNCCNM